MYDSGAINKKSVPVKILGNGSIENSNLKLVHTFLVNHL